MVSEKLFDDIVLGGGKGGKSLAMALGQAGRKVALVERGMIGGSCINVACIPTKTLVASVKVYQQSKLAHEFGVDLQPLAVNLAGIIQRKRQVVQGMVDKHWQLFTSTPNMELIIGEGSFRGPKEIEVRLPDESIRLLSASRIYINTGSRTTIPPIQGLGNVPYLTSTSIMELNVLPTTLAIIGGGYIALEFAQIFARLGTQVIVLLRGNRFLPNEDEEIALATKNILESDGIQFRSNVAIDSVRKSTGGSIQIVLRSPNEAEILECSHLFVAVGRAPNSDGLNLNAAGVEIDDRGYIKVNERLETTAQGIWAIGDCNGGPLFTHVSWDDYRIVRENVLNSANRSTNGRLVPYTLFIDPELGRVGLTEEQAKKQGYEILVAKLAAQMIPRANTSGERHGLLKVVIDKRSHQILGCSFLCHAAGEVMSVIQMAMIGKLPYQSVRDTIFTHPTMAESINLLLSNVQEH